MKPYSAPLVGLPLGNATGLHGPDSPPPRHVRPEANPQARPESAAGSAYRIIVMVASAGGVEALMRVLAAFPAGLNAAVFIVQHIGNRPSALPSILGRICALPVAHARDHQPIEAQHVFIAPPDHHMLLEPGWIRLNREPHEHYTRPAANPLFRSAAAAYGDRVIGVVLTGGDGDGGKGMQAVTSHGGIGIVEDPAQAQVPEMPASALRMDSPTFCVPVDQMGPLLVSLVGNE